MFYLKSLGQTHPPVMPPLATFFSSVLDFSYPSSAP